jgi:tagatose 1,6-diphosphate aldolase
MPFAFLDPGELRDGELELRIRARHDADPDRDRVAAYELVVIVGGDVVGVVSFRAQSSPNVERFAGHIGYRVDAAHRGHHYAERAVRLLLPFVKRHGLTSAWITCAPDNVASRRTCERLGAVMVDIVAVPPDHEDYVRARAKCRYRLDL